MTSYSDPRLEDNWHLKQFQRSDPASGKRGEHLTFVEHIEAAVRHLALSNNLVVFSGGATDADIPYTEAESYAAALAVLSAHGDDFSARVIPETDSTDSYQNLLFSILVFRRTTGRYPEHITVITHAFKSRRFLELHASAIKWPSDRITLQGIDPVWTDDDEYRRTVAMEESNALTPFERDPFGVDEFLHAKRLARQWDPSRLARIGDGLESEVRSLLEWRGPEHFVEQLPWSKSTSRV